MKRSESDVELFLSAFAVWLFRSCFADFHHLVLAQQFSRHHYALHLIKINLIKSSSQLTLGFSRVGSMKSIQNHMINSFIHRNKATDTHMTPRANHVEMKIPMANGMGKGIAPGLLPPPLHILSRNLIHRCVCAGKLSAMFVLSFEESRNQEKWTFHDRISFHSVLYTSFSVRIGFFMKWSKTIDTGLRKKNTRRSRGIKKATTISGNNLLYIDAK